MSEAEGRPAALVLVVEDEPIQRMTLVDIIEEGGFEVLEARDADTAVAVLESRTDVRLVVTDIQMPGAMDGMRLAAAVRDRWPPIEIVLISAGPQPSLEELPARVEFMPKPIITKRLLDKLTRMTGGA